MPAGIGYGKVGEMSKPTGPTGILSSNRKGIRTPGSKTGNIGGSKGITNSPASKMPMKKFGGKR